MKRQWVWCRTQTMAAAPPKRPHLLINQLACPPFAQVRTNWHRPHWLDPTRATSQSRRQWFLLLLAATPSPLPKSAFLVKANSQALSRLMRKYPPRWQRTGSSVLRYKTLTVWRRMLRKNKKKLSRITSGSWSRVRIQTVAMESQFARHFERSRASYARVTTTNRRRSLCRSTLSVPPFTTSVNSTSAALPCSPSPTTS